MMNRGIFGFCCCLSVSILVMLKRASFIYKIFYLCIISLPFSYIGILGMDMPHLFSWTNIYLLILISYLTIVNRGKLNINYNLFIIVLLLTITLILTCSLTIENSKSIIELSQIFVMVFTILLTWCCRYKIKISECQALVLMHAFTNTCIITAIATIIQWAAYFMFTKEIGFVTHMAVRVICNCLYKGMSVLSIFFGLAAILVLLQFGKFSPKMVDFLRMGILLFGVVANTSRSGLVGVSLVFLIYLINDYLNNKRISKFIILGVLGIALLALSSYQLVAVRGNLDNLLDDNGRFLTYKTGIEIWTQSIGNFLFGAGFEDSIWLKGGGMTSHNMLIQSLAQCGIISTSLFIILFAMYFIRIKKTPYVFLFLYIIITGMMITDFYANSFTTMAMCLIVIANSANFERCSTNIVRSIK